MEAHVAWLTQMTQIYPNLLVLAGSRRDQNIHEEGSWAKRWNVACIALRSVTRQAIKEITHLGTYQWR